MEENQVLGLQLFCEVNLDPLALGKYYKSGDFFQKLLNYT